jgi:hypothetical protein
MINCLVGYVGLKQVQDNPTSDLFLNDLHGITTDKFNLSREIEENDGIAEAWNTLESRAIRLFEMDLMSNLKKYFNNYQIIHTDLTGYVDDNVLADHGSGKYAGWLFDMFSYSQAQKVLINDVRIHLASAENFNIKIFDANTGQELFTKSIVGVVGIQTIKVLKEFNVYEHNKIFVCYDTVIPYRAFHGPAVPGALSRGVISTSDTVISTNLFGGENGLMVGYNIKCGIDEFVCSRLSLFLEPYLYKLGIEFLKTAKYSEQVNRYNLLGADMISELLEEYDDEYQRLLDSSFEDLDVPDDGICFICNKAISKRALIP